MNSEMKKIHRNEQEYKQTHTEIILLIPLKSF